MMNKDLNMSNIKDSQSDMRDGYAYGSIGVIVSGIIWTLSGMVSYYYSSQNGIWTLIIGGMFIFPIATLIEKLIGIRGQHNKNNPLGKLAMEGTIWMIMCIPLAYGLSLNKAEWFFQGMLMIIGGRYLSFASIFGMRIYWVLGAILALAAITLFKLGAGTFQSAFTGGIIEILFGIFIFVLYKIEKSKKETT